MSFFHSLLGAKTPVHLLGFDVIRDISVKNGTAFGSINFSDYGFNSRGALLSNGTIIYPTLTWQAGSYNGSVNATYTISATFNLPAGVFNTLGVVPQMDVTVVTFETEFDAVLTYATSQAYALPSVINQGDLNSLVAAYKAASQWTNKDRYYQSMTDGDSGFARIDYKTPGAGTNLLIGGTVTYNSRKGFTGNGSTGYLDPQYNPSAGTAFTQNDAGVAAYAYDSGTTGFTLGCVATGARIQIATFERILYTELNGNTNPSTTDENDRGWYHVFRTVSGSINLNKNLSTQLVATADTSVARPNTNLYFLCRGNAGVRDSFSNGTFSAGWVGASGSAGTTAMATAEFNYRMAVRIANTYTPSTIGQKVNDTFNRATLGGAYAVVGASIWTLDGVKMTANGSAGGFADRMLYKYGQSSENVTITGHFKNNSVPSSTTRGLGAVFSDFSGLNGERTIATQLSLTNTVSGGKCYIYTWDGTTNVQVATSAAQITIAQNDEFDWTLTKTINGSGQVEYTFDVNRTVGGAGVLTCTYANTLGDSTGDIGLISYGGSANITALNITFNDSTAKDIVVIGDSVAHGYNATSILDGYARRLHTTSFQISAGSGDHITDVAGTTNAMQGKLKNLLNYNGRYYALAIGGNDTAGGVSAAVWQNSLNKIAYAILNEGHRLVMVVPPPRSGADMEATLGAYYISAFGSHPYVDQAFLSIKDSPGSGMAAAYNDGDGVHPNTLGHTTSGNAGALDMPPLY